MKRTLRSVLALSAFAAVLTLGVAAPAPGYVDFGKITAAEKGQFVEVNLGSGLLKLVAVIAKVKDREAGELIAGLTHVRVNVVGLDDTNRVATTEKMTALRADLGRQGWEQIVTARGKKQEDVAIFVKHREEAIEGVVVTVIDGTKNEAVFVNVVGNIKPEQLAVLGEHLQIEHLKRGTKSGNI